MNLSLQGLKLDYVDLFLIEFPVGFLCEEDGEQFVDEDGRGMLDLNTDIVALWKVRLEVKSDIFYLDIFNEFLMLPSFRPWNHRWMRVAANPSDYPISTANRSNESFNQHALSLLICRLSCMRTSSKSLCVNSARNTTSLSALTDHWVPKEDWNSATSAELRKLCLVTTDLLIYFQYDCCSKGHLQSLPCLKIHWCWKYPKRTQKLRRRFFCDIWFSRTSLSFPRARRPEE